MRLFLLMLLVTLTGVACKKDESPKTVRVLREQYSALIDRGASPDSPEFKALAEELEKVPADASAYSQAQELLNGIRSAQAKRPPRPLAREGGDHDELETERSRCAELARTLGR